MVVVWGGGGAGGHSHYCKCTLIKLLLFFFFKMFIIRFSAFYRFYKLTRIKISEGANISQKYMEKTTASKK
jgi:hypothetical protein